MTDSYHERSYLMSFRVFAVSIGQSLGGYIGPKILASQANRAILDQYAAVVEMPHWSSCCTRTRPRLVSGSEVRWAADISRDRRWNRDRDAETAASAGEGSRRAAVDRGDGCDDGQAEAEAVVGRAVAEPLERLEDAAGIRRAEDRPGIGYG